MKLRDLNIGTQLALGLGCILLFVILLGVQSYQQEEALWQETKGLYEHPLQVRRALGELNGDILIMHRGMKDLVLTDNGSERQQIIQEIETAQANAFQKFDILYDRYLGNRSDIDTVHTEFVTWKPIRDETIRLLREGKRIEAASRTKSSGVGGGHVDNMMRHLTIMSDFSKQRGDRFYQTAENLKNSLILQLGLLIGIILLLSLGISYFLMKGIQSPLRELTVVTDQYRSGKMDARSRYVSANEFGTLSASFNALADTIQIEMLSRENASKISGVMLREDEIRSFAHELLAELLQRTSSQIGAIYLLNPEKTAFTILESIGLCDTCRDSFSSTIFEGEFGLALSTRQVQQIANIPEDTAFVFSTTGGEMKPREIITMPILDGKEVVAMISLSSVQNYSPEAIRLVHDISDILAARFNGVLANAQIQTFSKTLEAQNRELITQSQELISQTHELKEQNTELEIQKQQLDEANRLKSVFLSNMSHELRTPLNSVIALSGVLNRRLRGVIPDDEYSYLDVIERNGRHLLSLINDILDIARIEAGREDIHITRFSIDTVVNAVFEMVGPQAREKKIALHNRVDSSLPQITSDYSKCQHILQNLVANAVKFTKEGTVGVSAQLDGNDLHIAVTDTGIGIPHDKISFIFDEFRQADERTGRTYGGSGLGLSIAKKYALLLGGNITVESIPGTGSTFTLHLPLSLPPELSNFLIEPGNQSITDQNISYSGVGKTILLVEDSEPAIIQISDIIKEQGYLLHVARNGKEALEQINQTLPDALILDLMMPEVDGFTVLHMIRSQEKTAQIPVLILTAKQITTEELKSLRENHIHQLIQKGDISRSDLLFAVANMVSEKPEKKVPLAEKPSRPIIRESPVILVVEDNPDNMTTVRALLTHPYHLIEAIDGQAGIDQARIHNPDLILLDISLPVMDGFEVLDQLRKDECLMHTPVIALTARAMKGDREEILSRGFDGYLSKPIDAELLTHTIQRVLYGQ